MSGGDLDGDKFFVCWDSDLIPKRTVAPYSYPAAEAMEKKNITRQDIINNFVHYDLYLVGRLDACFKYWANINGVNSPQCIEISKLFAKV
jgi:hypothetical protein